MIPIASLPVSPHLQDYFSGFELTGIGTDTATDDQYAAQQRFSPHKRPKYHDADNGTKDPL
ncbi:MAG: hypothetical protein QNK27_02415 [Desulfuromusa sp.]|nr:hypothetical protein [Desulfuromusa sp.]